MPAETPVDDAAIPADTSRDAHQVQSAIYQKLGGAGRLAIACQLTETVRQIAMAGIRGRHPDYTEDQVLLAYARLTLGDDLVCAAWPGRTLVDP